MAATDDLVYLGAQRLGDLRDEVVFVGGAVCGLLITDPGAPATRSTDDVDVIIEVASAIEFHAFAARLRQRGIHEDPTSNVICRFDAGGLKLDVMPISQVPLGFTNRWYPHVLRTAQPRLLDGDPPLGIRLITATAFLATKCESYRGRGNGDPYHPDLEDIIAIVDGRPEIVDEASREDPTVRRFIAAEISELFEDDDAIRRQLPADATGDSRLVTVRDRILQLTRHGGRIEGP